MAFDVNTITAAGAVAIASATAGNKLVIDGCDATTDVLTKAQAVQIASRPVSPASTTTTVALAGSTDNHVYSYASFIQGAQGQPGGYVHSFFLYGHSENTPSTVVVVAVASSTEPVHLPEVGDVTNRTEVQFELTFSATDEVVTIADTSMYTTRGEFLLLKNRTVTTHAEGETTVGDNQDIYGNKRFKNGARFDMGCTFAGDVDVGGNLSVYQSAGFRSNVSVSGVISQHGEYSSPILRCDVDEDAYTDTYYMHLSSDSNPDIYADLGIEFNEDTSGIKIFGKVDDGGDTPDVYSFELNSNGRFTFYSDVYVSGGSLEVSDDLIVRGVAKLDAIDSTDADYPVLLKKNLLPYEGLSIDLGNSARSFDNVFCNRVEHDADIDIRAYDYTNNTDNYANISLVGYPSSSDAYPYFEVLLNNEDAGEFCEMKFRDGELTFDSSNGTSIGSMNQPIGAVVTSALFGGNNDTEITVWKNLAPESNFNINIGKLGAPFNEGRFKSIYIGTAGNSFVASASGISIGANVSASDALACLGVSGHEFAAVYAKNLNGRIPRPTSHDSAPPVGTIFLAYITLTNSASVGYSVSASNVIDLDASPVTPSGIDKIGYAQIDFTPTLIQIELDGTAFTTGKYTCLCGSRSVDLASATALVCLLMRIE